MKKWLWILLLMNCQLSIVHCQLTNWAEVRNEAQPGIRWWWMGSAVEITPIYDVQEKEE